MKLQIQNEDILVHPVEQDTDEWLNEFRPAGIGSSDIVLLVNPKGSFERTAFSLWKDRVGYEKQVFTPNEHTIRGKTTEPLVRDLVNKMTGMNFEPACISRQSSPYLRASLDGIDFEHDVLLEIKCPAKKGFEKFIETGQIPDYYYLQIQYQLLVSGADYAIYAVYNDMRPEPIIRLVENNLELQLDIINRCDIFWQSVQTKTPIGFNEKGELKMFPIRPIMIIDENYNGSLYVTESPQKIEHTFVLKSSNLKVIKETRFLNPNHECISK